VQRSHSNYQMQTEDCLYFAAIWHEHWVTVQRLLQWADQYSYSEALLRLANVSADGRGRLALVNCHCGLGFFAGACGTIMACKKTNLHGRSAKYIQSKQIYL